MLDLLIYNINGTPIHPSVSWSKPPPHVPPVSGLRRLLGSRPRALGSHQSSARQRRKPPGTYFLGTNMPSPAARVAATWRKLWRPGPSLKAVGDLKIPSWWGSKWLLNRHRKSWFNHETRWFSRMFQSFLCVYRRVQWQFRHVSPIISTLVIIGHSLVDYAVYSWIYRSYWSVQ